MCDTNEYAVGAVLGQWKDDKPDAIYYVGWTFDDAQMNYATTKEEFLVVMFAFKKFCPYLINSKMIIFIDHAALKHLLKRFNSKPRLIQWVLILQEFGLEIQDKTGHKM